MFYSWLFYLCIFLFCFQDVICKKRSHSKVFGGKIVGGYNTTIENVPYQVYMILEMNGEYYQCGGSIISSRYVLTAAHCITGIETVYLRFGSADSQSGGTVVTSRTFAQHPRYNSQTSDFDAALVYLDNPIKLDDKNMKAVKLAKANSDVPADSNVLVSGWGATSESGQTSQNLMAVDVKVVSNSSCKKKYSTLTSRMFCAGVPEGGKDSCQGDSGGPAVNDKKVQVGVVSFGIGCARPGYPGVYTKVSDPQVRSWIRATSGV